jgi:hypothetical protein
MPVARSDRDADETAAYTVHQLVKRGTTVIGSTNFVALRGKYWR